MKVVTRRTAAERRARTAATIGAAVALGAALLTALAIGIAHGDYLTGYGTAWTTSSSR